MHWTKLESASIQFMGEDKVIWALYQFNNYSYESHSTFSSWSSPWYNSNEKKRNSEKHTEIFLEFLVFLNNQVKGKSKNEKNYLHGKAPNKKKKNKEIFLGFVFSATANYPRNKRQKETGNIFGFSQSFSNTQEESKKINLAWIIQ